ncbi:MAG: hypothetical protein KGL39_45790 [Patescibacteria group bacterium]|nr:hypothetical protein [Patescibacteria group bacterium]
MPVDGDYLPPVVATLIAKATELIAELQAAKKELQAFDGKTYTAILDADGRPFVRAVEEAKVEAQVIASKGVTVPLKPVLNKKALAAAMLEMKLAGGTLMTNMAPNLAAAIADAAAASDSGGGVPIPVGGGKSGGGGKSLWPFLLAMAWGKGGGMGIPFMGGFGAGMAGLGTVGSFAGFGIEHLIMTALGVAGSGVSALGGAGLLGLGALGTAGVGMGADSAVMSSSIADTKTLYSDYTNLNHAIAIYGANSKQAHLAQAQLNYDMAQFGPVAGAAEMKVALLANTLNNQWDASTQAARVQAAGIMTQVLQLGQTYVPLVAAAAATNLGIINKSLDGPNGLFTVLRTRGVQVFTDLEKHFAANLPTAMDASSQAATLLLNTIDFLSNQTGGFMQKIDNMLTYANSPAGWAKWQHVMGNMIQDFHVWDAFLVILTKDIVDMFAQDSKTGQSIIVTLTQMLDKLHTWETSTSGASEIHNIFEVHKQEVLDLLALLPKLISTFGSIYLTVAPAFVTSVDAVLTALLPLLNALSSNPFGAWLLGLTLIAGKLGVLLPILKYTFGGITQSIKGIGAASTTALPAAAEEVSAVGVAAEGSSGLLSTMSGFLGAAGPIAMGALMLAPIIITVWDQMSQSMQSVDDQLNTFKTTYNTTMASIQGSIASNVASMGATFAQQMGADSSAPGAMGVNAQAESQALQDAVNNSLGTQAQIQQVLNQYHAAIQNAVQTVDGGYEVVDTNTGMGHYFTSYAAAVQEATNVVNSSDFGKQIQVMNGEIAYSSNLIPDVTKQWGSFSSQAQQVFNTLSTANGGKVDTQGVTLFFNALTAHAGNATRALASLQGTGDPALQSIIDSMKEYAGTNLSSTVNSYNNLRQAILNTESPQERATKAGQDYATMLARQMFPNIDQANQSLQFMANTLTKGNVPALQAMIDVNPRLVYSLMLQAGWAATVAGNWYQVAQGMNATTLAAKNAIAAANAALGFGAGASGGAGSSGAAGGNKYAAGGFVPIGGSGFSGEDGMEFFQVTAQGVRIYSASSSTTQRAIGGNVGGRGISINMPINVTIPAGSTAAASANAIAQAIRQAVSQEFDVFVRSLNAGAA